MNKLLEELRTIPQFNSFEKAVKEKLDGESFYVQEFMPEMGEFSEYDQDGFLCRYSISHRQAVETGIEDLLEDNDGHFAEFVCEEIGEEVVELIRSLIKELRK